MIKVQQESFFSYSKTVTTVKNSAANFGEMFSSAVNSVPADFSKYQCGVTFGEDMTAKFPPASAPDYFKQAWYDVCSAMDETQRLCVFNENVETALTYGYYYFVYDRKEGAAGYNAFNSRVETLGCVGCLELAIRSAEQKYNDNLRGGNEKKFTDQMQESLEALQEIMQKCLESGDSSIDRQIILADFDFEKSKAQILHEAQQWLQENGGDDLATMSDEKFQALMDRVQPTITKYLPDGTVLTINSANGKIISWDKPNLQNLNSLPII